jgi:hypothetical protein
MSDSPRCSIDREVVTTSRRAGRGSRAGPAKNTRLTPEGCRPVSKPESARAVFSRDGRLHALLHPYPAEVMEAAPVGRYVSNPRNEGPQCLAP